MFHMIKTPIYPLNRFDGGENKIYIKRDDLLPFSLGGNKVRIAQELLLDMKQSGCDAMLMYGDSRSNLCRVLGNACYILGIPCMMICSSTNHRPGEPQGGNSVLMEWMPVEVIPCKKEKIAETVQAMMDVLRGKGYNPYYIYGNSLGRGRESVAARAYAKAYAEILEYEQRTGTIFDWIFCPCGTGATLAGLICGHLENHDEKKIAGISISRNRERGMELLKDTVEMYFDERGGFLPEIFDQEIGVVDDYNLGGYGIYHQPVKELVREVFLTEGIPLDPVYTGKAMWGMRCFLKAHGIHDTNVLFLHTGGIPLFFDHLA